MVTAVLPALPDSAAVQGLDQAEARDGRSVAAEQHVLGTEIAVADVLAVGVHQRVEQLQGDRRASATGSWRSRASRSRSDAPSSGGVAN